MRFKYPDDQPSANVRKLILGILVLGMIPLSGCVNSTAHYDETTWRKLSQIYYREQINECLLKASKGELFAWQTLTQEAATVYAQMSGNAGIGQTLTRTSQTQTTSGFSDTSGSTANGLGVVSALQHTALATGSLVTTAMNVAARPFTSTLAAQGQNQIQIQAGPKEDPAYYSPILQFLNYTDGDLKSGHRLATVNYQVHNFDNIVTFVRWNGKEQLVPGVDYVSESLTKDGKDKYYVPIRFKGIYFDLSIAMMTKNALNSFTASGPTSAPKDIGASPPSQQKLRLQGAPQPTQPSAKLLQKPISPNYDLQEGQRKIEDKINLLNASPH